MKREKIPKISLSMLQASGWTGSLIRRTETYSFTTVDTAALTNQPNQSLSVLNTKLFL